MSVHGLHVLTAYLVSGVGVAALAIWIGADGRARRREIAELETGGARRSIDRRAAS